MKSSSPWVILIPLAAAFLVVGSVVVVKYMSPVPKEGKAAMNAQPTPANIPSFSGSASAPASGFEAINPSSPVADLHKELNGLAGENGDTDLKLLEEEANAL